MTIDELFKQLKQIDAKLDHLQSTPVKTHLKTRDACDYLSVCPNTLMKICIHYSIIPQKICGVNYYKVSDLDTVFRAGKIN
ncbi:MAG: DNA-binding protein [Sphingobacteriia bacterium]|nr:DNA-binding protein [Candidatus Fonsibacter lacus]